MTRYQRDGAKPWDAGKSWKVETKRRARRLSRGLARRLTRTPR